MLTTIGFCTIKVFANISVIATLFFLGGFKSKSLATRSTLGHTDIAPIRVDIKADHVNFVTDSAITDVASFRCHWN